MLKAPNYIHKRGERDARLPTAASAAVLLNLCLNVWRVQACARLRVREGTGERACAKEDRNDSVQLAW